MNEQINEQLALLEKELSRLQSVTDYIDDTKQTANSVITELKEVQTNFSTYTEKIFSLYSSTVEQIKKETELQIKEGVISFQDTGSKIDQTNREKLVETKKLLDNYRNVVEASDNLVKKIDSVDFPKRLGEIEKKITNNFHSIASQTKVLNLSHYSSRLISGLGILEIIKMI